MSAPQTIAHYRVHGKLREGGMGAVYRATDTRLNRDVAIKVIPDAFAGDSDRLGRFTREAQVLASLNHPNIAAIYGVEERSIVMELVEGQTLAGPISVKEAQPLILQLIDALEYAHEKGVIHRDLKPANIKITPEGRLKVLDFGLAKALSNEARGGDPAASPTLTIRATTAGMIIGTAGYMAPEQARGQSVDKRADIWAFGVVLYEILTGRQLFEGATVSDSLAAVLTKEPCWDEIPHQLQPLLRACLVRDARRRLRDIADARLLLELPGQPPPASATFSLRARLPRAISAILAVTAAAALWFAFRSAPATEHPLIRLNVDLGPDAIEGLRNTVALSPSGSRIVYSVKDASGTVRLALRALDQPKAQVLSGTEGASDSLFSPDERWIGFTSEGKIKKIPVQGGAAIDLGYIPNTRGIAWRQDGGIVYGVAGGGGLFSQPSGGGAAAPFTRLLPGEVTHRWPQFLTGERAVLFVSHTRAAGFDDAEIAAMSVATGVRTTLIKGGFAPRYLPSGHLLYVHDGALFGVGFDPAALRVRGAAVPVVDDLSSMPFSGGGQYDVSANGTLVYLSGKTRDAVWNIVKADHTGKTQLLPIPPGQYRYPTVSPDGRSIAWVTANRDLWVYDIGRETTTRLMNSQSTGSNDQPVWSPDSKHLIVAWTDGKNGQETLWCVRADGAGEPQQLALHASGIAANSFSPDGKRLAVSIFSQGSAWDIATLPIDWSDPDQPATGKAESVVSTPMIEKESAFSPNGKWIAYRSGDNSSLGDVFVQPFAGPGGRLQISSGGGSSPQWSRDGRQLFFVTADFRIMVSDITLRGSSVTASKPRIWIERQLMDLNSARSYAVMPDGEHLLMLPQSEQAAKKGSPHIVFLLNFSDELRRRIP